VDSVYSVVRNSNEFDANTRLMDTDTLTEKIIGCAIEVHRTFGPGLLESAYEHCLARELSLNDIPFRIQVPVQSNTKALTLIADIGSTFWLMNE
jgi:hypothetical protein